MDFVPVILYPFVGYCVVLRNFAIGCMSHINCVYIVGRCNKRRHAKKIANALNEFLNATKYGDEFSSFRAEVLNFEFPAGAKNLAPLHASTPDAVRSWAEENIPLPIQVPYYENRAPDRQLCSIQ